MIVSSSISKVTELLLSRKLTCFNWNSRPDSLVARARSRKMSSELMMATRGTIAPWMASVTFGGPDLKTVYLGSLMGTRIPYFAAPLAGLPMVHWK